MSTEQVKSWLSQNIVGVLIWAVSMAFGAGGYAYTSSNHTERLTAAERKAERIPLIEKELENQRDTLEKLNDTTTKLLDKLVESNETQTKVSNAILVKVSVLEEKLSKH